MAQIVFLIKMKNIRAISVRRITPQLKPTMGPPKMPPPGLWCNPLKDYSAVETYDGPTLKAISRTMG